VPIPRPSVTNNFKDPKSSALAFGNALSFMMSSSAAIEDRVLLFSRWQFFVPLAEISAARLLEGSKLLLISPKAPRDLQIYKATFGLVNTPYYYRVPELPVVCIKVPVMLLAKGLLVRMLVVIILIVQVQSYR